MNITLENEPGRGTYGYTYKIKQVFNNMSLVCKVLKAIILEFLADDTKILKKVLEKIPTDSPLEKSLDYLWEHMCLVPLQKVAALIVVGALPADAE